MCNRSFSQLLLVCLVAFVGLSLVAAGPADCRKTTKLYEAIPLEEWSGGAQIRSLNYTDQDDTCRLAGAGLTRQTGGPWRACVWSWQDPEPPWPPPLEPLPALDVTRDSGANFILYGGCFLGQPPESLFAAGYSYDASGLQQPVVWIRAICDTPWTLHQLPTLSGGEGVVNGIVQYPFDVPVAPFLLGWSAGGTTNKAVIWTDNGAGGWAVTRLPHGSSAWAGCVHDGFVSAENETTVCGWSANAVEDTIPTVWQNDGGGWVKTWLPLLSGGTQGIAYGILGEEADDILGEEAHDMVGWSENSMGQRRAVRWYKDGGWQVQELDPLPGTTTSGAIGIIWEDWPEPGYVEYIVGTTTTSGPPVGTVWGLTGEEGHDIVRDINDLIVSENPPTIRGLTDFIWFVSGRHGIAANGEPGQMGQYSMSQSSDPHAYLLVETEVVPALASYKTIALLIALLAVTATLGIKRRRMVRVT